MQGFLPNAYEFEINDLFWMFQVFIPPVHPASSIGVEPVPLHMLEWRWAASGSRTMLPSPSPWSGPGGGVTVTDSIAMPTWRLQWDDVYVSQE
jgi:hypothetical protein